MSRARLSGGGASLQAGKLPPTLLRRLLRYRGAADSRVIIGPRFGEDAAVIDLGGKYLVLKSDPVTFTADEVGWYAVHVNANDVAVMGAVPAWFQSTIIVPPGTTAAAVEAIGRDIHRAARRLGIAVTGGHTEVSPAVTRAIVAGDMQGLVRRRDLVTSAGARDGDCVVLTGAAAIEGTSILARSCAAAARRLLGPEGQRRAARFHHRPGISVVRAARIGAACGATAMHDPTEGGVAMGLVEMATASGVGLDVDLDAIAVLPPTRTLCAYFGLRPLGLIASGALLVTVPASRLGRMQRAWRSEGISARVIGAARRGRGVRAWLSGRRVPFAFSERDELTRLFAS